MLIHYFPEGEAYEDVWVIRKKGLGLMLGIKGNKKPLAFIEDAGIPVEVLPEYIDQVLGICQKASYRSCYVCACQCGGDSCSSDFGSKRMNRTLKT